MTQCLYLYNTIVFFHHFLVLRNETKTLTLMSYLILVFKVLNRQVYS